MEYDIMASFQQPKAWNLSPQMTAAPALWRGCHWCYAPGMFMSDKELVSGDTLTRFSTDQLSRDDYGRAYLQRKSNPEYLIGTKTVLKPTTALTVAVFTNLLDPQQLAAPALSSTQTTGQWGDSSVFIGPNGGTYRWLVRVEGLEARIDTPSSSTVSGPQILVGVRNSAGSVKFYYRDTYRDVEASSAAGPLVTTHPFVVGAYYDLAFNRRVSQELYWAAYWDRELSASEIEALRRDPFIMLRPQGA